MKYLKNFENKSSKKYPIYKPEVISGMTGMLDILPTNIKRRYPVPKFEPGDYVILSGLPFTFRFKYHDWDTNVDYRMGYIEKRFKTPISGKRAHIIYEFVFEYYLKQVVDGKVLFNEIAEESIDRKMTDEEKEYFIFKVDSAKFNL